MIVKITGNGGKGTSFKGAGLYYLHDKGALSKNRVAFTLTQNLATNDPDIAIAMMAHTALNQNAIKQRAGGSTRGRKLTAPVYTYSLSWAPDEAPSREDMIEAAQETLAVLGLQGHEALLVSHNDEPHPHVHVIVNRVNPDNGIAAKLSNDRLLLSAWAEDYERRQGQIRCEQRVENNQRRKKGEYVKDSANDNSAFHDWRRQRVEEDLQRRREDRDDLTAAHRAQRQALYADKEALIHAAKAKIRDDHKAMWAALFESEKRDRQKLAFEQKTAKLQLRQFLRNNAKGHFHAELQQRSGHLSAAFGDAVEATRKRKALDAEHRKGRAAFAGRIAAKQRNAFKSINDKYKGDLAALKDQQAAQQQALAKRQSEQSQEGARRIKSGADYADFLKEKLPEHFAGQAADRERAAPEFNKGAKDRPRAARDFSKAAEKPSGPQHQVGSGEGGRVPRQDQVDENAADITRPGKHGEQVPAMTREQRAAERLKRAREQAKEITNPKSQNKGRERTKDRDKRPKND